jgi:hypothetical protein
MEPTDNKKHNLNFVYLLVLALGIATALIFYMRSQSLPKSSEEKEIDKIVEQSSSDEINKIEADLQSTDLENIDREVEAIDAELNAGY